MPPAVLAQSPATRVEDDVVVLGRWDNPIGQSTSASQGVVGAGDPATRDQLAEAKLELGSMLGDGSS